MRSVRLALGSFLFLALYASTSLAQVQRTFVSGLGSDSNPCSRTAPCRTFAQAITQTNPGGEILALDIAGYGPININKSISITSPPGGYAGISVFAADGIEINAGLADIISVHGVKINNQGSSGNGIVFNSGAALRLENCVVNGFSMGDGIQLNGSGNFIGTQLSVTGNNNGIDVATVGSVLTSDSTFEGNRNAGIVVLSDMTVVVRCAAKSNGFGLLCKSTGSANPELNVESCVVSNNATGVASISLSTGVATVRLSNSTCTGNGTGLLDSGAFALFLSRGNNTVEGNTTNKSGTIGSYQPM